MQGENQHQLKYFKIGVHLFITIIRQTVKILAQSQLRFNFYEGFEEKND